MSLELGLSPVSSTALRVTESPVFAYHLGGKLAITPRHPMAEADLPLAYTPGVAQVCAAIAAQPEASYRYTGRGRTIAVLTDGSAVLGLGNIGPLAAMPVMEGKAMLFSHFAQVDAVPLCVNTTDVAALVELIAALEPSFGGINLEDISAPRCFELERKLQERLSIPVFHDDQHGTAIVVLAALMNAVTAVGKDYRVRIVISGAGAAGFAVASMLVQAGYRQVVVCDSTGVIGPDRTDLPAHKKELAEITNPGGFTGSISDALIGADVFIGVSGGSVPESAVAGMAADSIIFALANPNPEINPEIGRKYAAIMATGRSDYPHQINNVLAFPGVFAGALRVRATRISDGMKYAAAEAIAALVPQPTRAEFIPKVFDPRVALAVADAVAATAIAQGLTRN